MNEKRIEEIRNKLSWCAHHRYEQPFGERFDAGHLKQFELIGLIKTAIDWTQIMKARTGRTWKLRRYDRRCIKNLTVLLKLIDQKI